MEPRHKILVIYLGVLLAIAAISLFGLGPLLGPKRKNKTKESPYECGSPLKQATRSPFDVRFFMLAMLFILFDIETVLLLPYFVQYQSFGVEGLVIAGIFFLGLVESLVYAWKKGALDWK